MKKILLLSLCILLQSCWLFDNDDDELEPLPPTTQTGENTMGYYVNGEPIRITNSTRITAIYQQGQLQLGGGIDNSNTDISVIITIGDPLGIGTIKDLTYANNVAIFVNNETGCYYDYTDTTEGFIRITHIDRVNFIISGVFEFSTQKEDCETINITDGRFDVKYIP